ncbi:unnamed protein product [Ilex paraguariensis]|uniref:NB-ARC domain-containing protein n=1 Tax=Ilex paraguariensis TaxID=185542 RepID=A0ABC8U1P3_9AQUA
MADALQWRMGFRESFKSQVRNFFSPSNSLATRIRMGRRLKAIRETLEMIAQERSSFRLSDGVITQMKRRPETGSFVIESEIVGRTDDRNGIVHLLIGTSTDERDVSVIPIVGIAGVGKTTLAQLVYNDERIERNFDMKLWVCVSFEFDLKKLMEAIIQCATKSRCDLLEMDILQSRLQESLRGRRFLLIMDDVWNEDHEEWEKLITLLRCGDGGSKFIVTTRNQKLALLTGTTSPYHLGGLSDDNCWSLFKQRAFGRGEEKNCPKLQPTGKELVKKCGGCHWQQRH